MLSLGRRMVHLSAPLSQEVCMATPLTGRGHPNIKKDIYGLTGPHPQPARMNCAQSDKYSKALHGCLASRERRHQV